MDKYDNIKLAIYEAHEKCEITDNEFKYLMEAYSAKTVASGMILNRLNGVNDKVSRFTDGVKRIFKDKELASGSAQIAGVIAKSATEVVPVVKSVSRFSEDISKQAIGAISTASDAVDKSITAGNEVTRGTKHKMASGFRKGAVDKWPIERRIETLKQLVETLGKEITQINSEVNKNEGDGKNAAKVIEKHRKSVLRKVEDIQTALNEIETHKSTLNRINEQLNSIESKTSSYAIQSVIALYNNEDSQKTLRQKSNGMYDKSDVDVAIKFLMDNGKLKNNMIKKVKEEYKKLYSEDFDYKSMKSNDPRDYVFIGDKAVQKKCSKCGDKIRIINKTAIA